VPFLERKLTEVPHTRILTRVCRKSREEKNRGS
jgi:hypothetical protein